MANDQYDSSVHEDIEQAKLQRGRQFENHEDLRNDDPSDPTNAALLNRQENQNLNEIQMLGGQGMEIEDGNEPSEDDGGLSGIRPSEEEEIDNSGKIKRSDMGGL